MEAVERWTTSHWARAEEHRRDLQFGNWNLTTLTELNNSGIAALHNQHQLLVEIRLARTRLQQAEEDLQNAILHMRQVHEPMVQ